MILTGDCVERMRELPDASVDAVVTDPPYFLTFMARRWDDGGDPENQQRLHREWATEAFRVLKPGGYLLAFGGTRTYHRLASAIEDAGFEIRDTLMWIYACLSDDTELLTREHGWVRYNRANEGDHAAAFDTATGELRWEPIRKVHAYDHVGPMVEVGPSLVTLNHRVILDTATARVPHLPRVWEELSARLGLGQESHIASMLASVQRQAEDSRPPLSSGPGVEHGATATPVGVDEGPVQSGLEGRRYRVQEARELLWSALRSRPRVGAADGPEGRVRDGAPAPDGGPVRLSDDPNRSGEPREPRPYRQPARESNALAGQPDPQAVRVREGDRGNGLPTGDTPRLVDYAGVVWCITVPSGAFVARRGGVAFVTGNSGFPKSLDVSKALDKAAGAEREVVGTRSSYRPNAPQNAPDADPTAWQDRSDGNITAPATDLARKWEGWGTALKPAHEPIVMARKPLVGTVAANVTRYGTGALNIDGTRIGMSGATTRSHQADYNDGGWRTGHEIVELPGQGRWPSNVLLQDPELFDEPNPGVVGSGATSGGGEYRVTEDDEGRADESEYRMKPMAGTVRTLGDSGGYSRFFLVPKADRAEREPALGGLPVIERSGESNWAGECNVCGSRMMLNGKTQCGHDDMKWVQGKPRANTHPTVKPLDLMRHLVRLVTPPGGTVLDPFLGSGTTAIACEMEGFAWIGIEREREYVEIAEARLNGVQRGLGLDVPAPEKRRKVLRDYEIGGNGKGSHYDRLGNTKPGVDFRDKKFGPEEDVA